MKKISKYLVLIFISLFGIIGMVSAVDFPNSINSSINRDVGNYGLLGTNEGWRIYAKSYTGGGASGKAFCTAFGKYAPDGETCSLTTWSTNTEMNDRVSAMIGSVINYVREDDSSISWDNYYYTELAINRLLYYGYTDNRGYGSKYNSLDGLPVNNGIFKKDKYEKLLSIANYTYNNYGKTKVNISSVSYDSSTGVARAKVVCTDYAGSKISCSLTKKKVKYSTDGSNWREMDASIATDDHNFITANVGNNAVKVQFEVEDKKCWKTAQNYSCGDYQSLTLNYLGDSCKTISAKSPVITNNNFKLEVHKRDVSNRPLKGAQVLIKKDGVNFIEDNDGYVELVDGAIDFNNVAAGTYCITEVRSPIGYKKSVGEQCVTINESNPTGTITIVNEKNNKNLTINKVDEKGNPVSGAKIKVYYYEYGDISSVEEGSDVSGQVTQIAEFVTDGNPKVIEGLEVGKTYTIVEEEIPKGYSGGITAAEITISEDESKNVVMLTNTHSLIKVSKQSITSTKELPGAKLTITDAQGNVVANWTSTDKPQEIEGLSDGDYTLTETTAPQGYTVAESINFTIEGGVVKGDDDNMVVMKDATIVEVPDTFNIQNIIAMIAGVVLVGLGTGVLFYETKKKKA